MSSSAVILDGYVDEPSCLGVPPYISPYVRYVAGVLMEHGYRAGYRTIDQLRADPSLLQGMKEAGIVVIIAGMTVPGKYLGGTPATRTEIRQVATSLREPEILLGGPIGFGWSPGGGRRAVREPDPGIDAFLEGEMAAALDSYLSGGEPEGSLAYPAIDRWSVLGAGVIRHHPSFPHVMCEMETARGCARSVAGGCSFCTEPFYGSPRYREPEGIWEEAAALYQNGARHFRLGRQPDLLAYQSGGGEFPLPRPDAIEELFTGIRKKAPGLATLHIDNI
ncbi:MAG: radical SAM protein, partial [Methanomicrobiaceae archaeon]|nr:radical SAM protein [Methanomicrobiaceae archaeon]